MTDKNRLYTGTAIGLVAAAALGFGAARLTQSSTPAPAPTEAAAPAKPSNTVAMTQQALSASQITVAPAASGELDAAILASATVEATLLAPARAAPAEFLQAADCLSRHAMAAYRALVYDTPGFADWFFAATPIAEIAELNLGSRPASRKSTRRIEDLRAIPWGFSWGQCRLLLPGWLWKCVTDPRSPDPSMTATMVDFLSLAKGDRAKAVAAWFS